MNKVSRSPLGAPRRAPSVGIASLLRAHVSLALAFALLVSLAPLGAAARAQGATKESVSQVEEGYSYIIEQTPDGDATCRIALPNEIGPIGGGEQLPVRQINHLRDKESATTSSAGLIIVLRATERLEQNPTAKAAFIAAAAKWEARVSTPITITIDVDYGPDFFGNTANPYGTNTLGQTGQATFRVDYSVVRQRLLSRVAAGSPEAALLNSLPAGTGLPTDLGPVPDISIPRSMMSALGLPFNEADNATVPRIGFNTNFTFDFDHTNGFDVDPVTGRTATDFDSVAVHEIGHALGFNSRVGGTELSPPLPLRATVWDFFRFRPGQGAAFSTSQRLLKSGVDANDSHVHFSGGAELALSTGKPDGSGGDSAQASHWKDNRNGRPFIGIMDPTIPGGRHEELTQNDIDAIDFFGYSVAGGAPPPPPPPAPANDNFAAAQSISGSAGRVTGTNVGATKEAGEPSHSDDNDQGGKSVWYAWTAPSSGSVNFNTGQGAGGESPSNFDTVLAAYTGTSVGGLTALAKDDDVDPGVVRTSTITFNVVGGTTYRIAVDGWEADEGGIALNWSHTTSGGGGGQPSVVSFSSHAFAASEAGGAAVITLIRSNPEAALSVGVRTIDNPAAIACNDTATMPGVAFARCDYATTIDTVRFAPGESTRTISVPLINDSYGEPSETVDLELAVVPPAQMGVVPMTRLTITSDEAPGQDGATNPVNGVPFFVRQHYLDFLSREPEVGEPWSNVLNTCPDQLNKPGCDRLTVSEAFFGSPEFALKARYAFRFYKVAFNRLPEYSEIVVDMRQLAGATGEEVIAKRAVFPAAFVLRTQFTLAFGGMTNQQYVDTLMNRYNLQGVTSFHPTTPEGGAKITFTRAALVASLNGGTFTRAQVLRVVADSDEVTAAEFRPSFVAIQYYGYLRRTPEPTGYNNWLNYLNANPDDSRTMVNGFLNSAEYRLRFGRN